MLPFGGREIMFLQVPSKQALEADGDTESKICLIGEAASAWEMNAGKLFVGPPGRILEQCLHGAGLIRGELYITSFIKEKVTSMHKYYNEKTGKLTTLGEKHQEILLKELEDVDANIIVTLGNAATVALLGPIGKILKLRGYIFESALNGRKVLPTINPIAAMRGNYIYRHFITSDFRKAKMHSHNPEVTWEEVFIDIPETFEQVMSGLEAMRKYKLLSIDIEVMNHEMSCIGFTHKDNHAFVVPLYHQPIKWSEAEEVAIWGAIAGILEDSTIQKIGQNFIFDMQFSVMRNRIITKGFIEDTMILNNIILPDFPKGLEFLVSIHCNRPHWKGMVKWKGADLIKKDN